MFWLITYVLIALVFSFLCSIAEAVLLSVRVSYIALLEKDGNKAAPVLRALKDDVNQPLAAILTLNTIAHTIGAAGAGAEAAMVFGSAWVGVASAVLTLLILIFSEIIPKTLGATYWQQLAPATAYGLRFTVVVLKPFVWLSEKITKSFTSDENADAFNREEFTLMAELGEQEGQLNKQETKILKNLFMLKETSVNDIMTPRSVVFSLTETMTVEEFFLTHVDKRFSRIPIYRNGDKDHMTGFVLRQDLILAYARGNTEKTLTTYERELLVLPDASTVHEAFEELLRKRTPIMTIVDEFGGVQGIVTLEDVMETLLGLEILDEGDKVADMQTLARNLRKTRMKETEQRSL